VYLAWRQMIGDAQAAVHVPRGFEA
jgi:hypothetical protein